MGDANYSPLSDDQITVLKGNGCWAADWASVKVAEGFNPNKVVNTTFKGEIKIGSMQGGTETSDGIEAEAFIAGANLNNVTIGDDCHIRNVHSWIQNMDLGNNVIIMNVGRIVCLGESTFGNGQELEVHNEGGGRELKITAKTNAQVAYLTIGYRHNADLIAKLDGIAERYAADQKSDRGTIGDNVEITDSGTITNVNIGPNAVLTGVKSLDNGTIVSGPDAPTVVGSGVTAVDFIMQKGASVKSDALVQHVLVGEGTKIGNQFSGENSVFFANSEGFHSEACSVFGGPYTVTHHKSTLLIAGLFSFYNAGSGTNQSNHMYKLGPVHQGTLERGCKTGSFSYLLWPSKVGAFTAIMGKHYANFDTTDFPFSYIDENGGKSTIVPGMNFFTVGTLRDGAKWPARDRRKNNDKLDVLVFDVLSPFTGQKMLNGQRILMELYDNSEKGQDMVSYQGINIKRLLLKTCRRYYNMALDKYFGDAIVQRMKDTGAATVKEMMVPDADGVDGSSDWIDVCGLLCTRERLNGLIDDIVSGKLDSFDAIQEALLAIQAAYRSDEWNWFLKGFGEYTGNAPADMSDEDWEKFLAQWQKSSVKLYKMVLNDASKEFEGQTKTGFGIDGEQDADFEAVRGTFDGNSFVKSLQDAIGETEKKCADLKAKIS